MKDSFDTDSILFGLLNKSPLKTKLSGGIYPGDGRPDDSTLEDVVINSIALTQDYLPQIGTSNVNIYVPDANTKVNGKEQLKSNRNRLKELSSIAIDVLRNSKIHGVKLIVGNQTILSEPSIKQHFVNIRVSWNIQTE